MISKKPPIKKFSTIGFIFVNIGAAVGLGNIWRFPQQIVNNGGSSFIFIYLIVLVLFALPIILLEMQYGLFFRKSPVTCFEKATQKSKTRFFGWIQIFAILFLSIYYIVITAWVLSSLLNSFVPSLFHKMASDNKFFDNNILGNDKKSVLGKFSMSIWIIVSVILLIIGLFVVLGFSIVKGIEKANLFLVPGLFILIIGLVIYALTLPKSIVAINFLFKFDSESFTKFSVWAGALKQAVFSTGIFIGLFIIFSRKSNIKIDKGNDALIVICADTIIGIFSGILITCIVANNLSSLGNYNGTTEAGLKTFFADKENSGGTNLAFVLLPKIFGPLGSKSGFSLGYFLNLFFFLSLFFAAFSSLICLVDVSLSSFSSELNISRKKTLTAILILIFVCLPLYASKIGSGLVGVQDRLIVWTTILIGFFQILFFASSKRFSKILIRNQKYSYFKLAKWGIYRLYLLFFVLPAILFFVIFIFGEDVLIKTFNFSFTNESISFDFGKIKIANWVGIGMFLTMIISAIFLYFFESLFWTKDQLNKKIQEKIPATQLNL